MLSPIFVLYYKSLKNDVLLKKYEKKMTKSRGMKKGIEKQYPYTYTYISYTTVSSISGS